MLLREAFSAHGGIEVDTQGDAFFVAFPTAAGAAAAARAGREALAVGPIRVRMGIHSGAPDRHRRGLRRDRRPSWRARRRARPWRPDSSSRQLRLRSSTDEPLRDLGLHRLKDFEGARAALPARRRGVPAAAHARERRPAYTGHALPRPRARALRRRLARGYERDPRVLTVVGPGRHGQDSLRDRARTTARRRRRRRHRHSSRWRPSATAALVAARRCAAARRHRLRARGNCRSLGERRTHVVVDNLEHLLPARRTPARGGRRGRTVAPHRGYLARAAPDSGRSELDLPAPRR